MPKRVVAACLLLFLPQTANAALCDYMKVMAANAPSFVSLRGEQTGSEFHGSYKEPAMVQCEVRNKSPWPTPIEDSKWSYECLWEKVAPTGFDWLKQKVSACFPDATYTNGTRFEDSTDPGGVFHEGSIAIAIDYNTSTQQLWLTFIPAGTPMD